MHFYFYDWKFLKRPMNEKITKMWLLLFLMMPFTIVTSQVSDLSLIGGLTEGLSKQNNQEPLLPDEEDKEKESNIAKPKELISFEDKNFGFTGGKSFNSNPQPRFSDQPLKYFGYDFFSDAPSTFAPVTNIPIPKDYIVGPGDNIKVLLFGNKNNQFTLKISREGEIFFPEIGPINIAGLTFSEMKSTIEGIVRNQIIGTEANITLGNLRSINIFILGDAFQPGMYTVSALSTLTNAIFASGGINVSGSLRDIQLKRNGRLISSFDFYDLLLKGDTSNDKRLMSGDVIFIPPITKTVGIDGEVFRPGIYELKEEETLYDLIKYAANQKPKADSSSAQIERIDSVSNVFKLIEINLVDRDSANINLETGDTVRIFPVQDNLNNAVLLSGHAQQPGFYPWFQGMKISDLVDQNNLLVMTDLNYVLIKKENKLTQKYEIFQTDLEKVFADPNSSSNIILDERDEVILLPRLLNTNQITTSLIQDDIDLKDETESRSLRYLNRSIKENLNDSRDILVNNNNDQNSQLNTEDLQNKEKQKYYEYTVYNYCIVSEETVIELIQENENEENLTKLCRDQLIDPLLDILQVQQGTDNAKQTISIFGNVRFPGQYPHSSSSMTAEEAIKAAGGKKGGTYEDEIEVSRKTLVNKEYLYTKLKASSLDTNNSINIALKPMDIVSVKLIKDSTGIVEVQGETYFTGTFPIEANETLGSLIKRAGGLTKLASPEAAVFTREALRQKQAERIESATNDLMRRVLLSSRDIGQDEASKSEQMNQLINVLSSEDDLTDNLGRIVINLEAIIEGTLPDIVLEPGDKLIIPRSSQSVSVIGEVYIPTTHMFDEDSSLTTYLNLSGGTNPFADLDNVYLIRSNGSIVSSSQLNSSSFFRSGKNMIKPGDTIVVPLKIRNFDGLQATTEITQIVYQMAVAAAAVSSF